MLNVLITIDTEIWCDGWQDLDKKFPKYFEKYVYGPTKNGNYALPGKLDILEQYNIPAVFFVEPLFSARFGLEPLKELVGLLQEYGQEIQLHMHSEWVNEAGDLLLSGITDKLKNMTYCSREQQSQLIKWGLQRLTDAGVSNIRAFRAGSFGANTHTLQAVSDNNIIFDTSYNLSGPLGVADMVPGEALIQPRLIESVYEYPVSVIKDPIRKRYRNVQINSLSYTELVNCLNNAYESGWNSLVIVSHNFELLSKDKTRVDKFALRRFRRLCQYLDTNRDRFNTTGFNNLTPTSINPQPEIKEGKLIPAIGRYLEQVYRQFVYH